MISYYGRYGKFNGLCDGVNLFSVLHKRKNPITFRVHLTVHARFGQAGNIQALIELKLVPNVLLEVFINSNYAIKLLTDVKLVQNIMPVLQPLCSTRMVCE